MLLFYYIRILKMIYGNIQASTNSTTPAPNFKFFSSRDPEIIRIIAKNPISTGSI